MGKNIVVFSDGTNQDGGRGYNSNVYKLFNMIEDRTDRQVAFYDRGLGTGWRKVTGNAFGAGISHNILECYEFIFSEFQAGDVLCSQLQRALNVIFWYQRPARLPDGRL